MNSLLNKLRKRKSSTDAVSVGSNSSLFNSGTISICSYSVNEKQLQPFLKAVWKNDLIKVKKLMKKNYNVVDQDKRSGLHLACAAGFVETIKDLLSNYANEILEKRDINQKTALYKAVEKGIYENVQLLLDKGAKTDVKDDMGESLIHAAIRYKHADVLQHLLQKDINCNETNKEGMTPLHLATELNFVDGMNLLLRHTRNIDAIAKNGKTALMIAAESGFDKAVKVLLSNNADASIDDKLGYDALYYATFHENTECIKLLKEIDSMYSVKPEFSPKHTVTLEAPKFLETLSSPYNNGSLKSENSNEDSEHVISKSKQLQIDKQKEDSKILKFHSQESVQSNGTWIGEFTNTSSDPTMQLSHKTLAIHDISTPSSMPNPSDIDINPPRPVLSSLYNSQFKRSMSDDEESQWSNNDKSHMESSRDRINEVSYKASKENVEIKSEIVIEKASDSEWDSDDTEHQDIQVKLSTIDEESVGKKSRISFLKGQTPTSQQNKHDQDSSDLSMMLKPSYGDDGNLTDSNIEECFNANYIVTNPPIRYDSVDNLSVDEDTDTDVLNDLYSSQITNVNYKQNSPAPSSKPPKSPSVNKEDKNIPTITVEEFSPKTSTKNVNLQGGDNIDINVQYGLNSDLINDNKKSNMCSLDDYVKKCIQLESKLRSLESEKNFLQMNINSVQESKDKSDIEKLKLQNQYQKLETMLSENTDKLSDFKERYVGIEEQLKKREKELSEVKKTKQEIEDKFQQMEINNLTSSSKMKQGDTQDYRKKYDDELKDWIKTSDELKTEINNLKKQLTIKNTEIANETTGQNEVVQNLKNQIEKQKKAINRENEDKISLQEEIDQLRKTIKNLNSDLESSNKTIALATKQERENSGLKNQIQDMDKKISQLTKDNEGLNKELTEAEKNTNKSQMEIDRLENQLKLKDDRISLLEMQYRTFENQSRDLEKFVERKDTEHKELGNKYSNIETELKMEMKKNKNALEIANDAIRSGTINSLDSGELLESLQNVKRSLNNGDIEIDRMDKLEKLEAKHHNELQNKSRIIQNHQPELTQLDRENMDLKECLKEEREKHQLLYEKDKSLSIQLRNEIKKRKQLVETLDSVKYWLDKYNKQISTPNNQHLVSSQIDMGDNGYSSIPNECSILLQNLAEMNDDLQMKLKKSELKVTEFQSQKSSLDKNQEIVNENSQNLLSQQLNELTQMMENQRLNREKLEKIRDENEFQLRNDLYQTKQQNMMEISQLANKTSIIDEDRQVLMHQNKILNEALAKERELKDSLTEQLVNLIKASHGSNQQLNGYEPIIKSSNGFHNSTSQISIPMNLIENEKRSLANSMLNLNIPKSIGVEDDELRQKLRQDLDRSIARHLESGKPIRQLNIKEKIRSLSIGRYPISTVSWKSP